jgi:signal transduction histidine kinase
MNWKQKMSKIFQVQNRYVNFRQASNTFLTKLFPNQVDLDEEERKGAIFSAFLAIMCIVLAIVTVTEFYFVLTLTEQAAQTYIDYIIRDLGAFILLSLIWWGHRRHPKLMRHLFLILMVIGIFFLFEINELNQAMNLFTLPIIMAAFLIQPIYSFVYYLFITCLYVLRLYLAGFTLTDDAFSYINLASLLVLVFIAWLIAQSLDKALAETKALNVELDQRVQDRTRELAASLEREQAASVRNTTILQSIADGIMVLDANQEVLMANPAANRLAGQNLQSASLSEILSSIKDEGKESLRDWLAGQHPQKQGHVKFQWHDKIVSANVAPVVLLKGEGKQVDAGNVIALRDFTREAELERAKDIFLGMVSHELRTPMSAIKGYVEVLLDLEKETISPEGYEYLQTIDTSVRQLLILANDLIDLSRLETGEIELYREWVDVPEIVNQAAQIVQQEFVARNLRLAVNVEEPLPKLYVDKRRILQVLLNLLSNAYKYTTEGGATVHVGQSEEWVNIAVTDTGVGIRKSDQTQLFQRFFRATDQVIQQAGGTGLGLAISKGFTELHGGKLTFESQYGVGTTFNVALPKNGISSISDEIEKKGKADAPAFS